MDASDGPSSLFTEDGDSLIGSELPSVLENAGLRTSADSSCQKPFTTFYPPDYSIACSDEICTAASVLQLDSTYADFDYDADLKLYSRRDQPDIAFTNLLLLEVDILYNAEHELNIRYDGGTGFYLTNGTVREIRWQVFDGRIPSLVLRDEHSNTLYLNAGSSYFMFYQYDEMIFHGNEESPES